MTSHRISSRRFFVYSMRCALAAGLSMAGTTVAMAGCPAVGSTIYIGNNCSTPGNNQAACYKRVINWKQDIFQNGTYQRTLYTYNLYANGYYQWVYQGTSDVIGCQR